MYRWLIILIFMLAAPTLSYGQTERDCQKVIHEQIGGVMEYRLDDGTRVDLLLPNRAIEIDWATKWGEGVGQSLYYSIKTSRPPVVLLLAKDAKWMKYAKRVETCGIECWVWNVRTEKFIYGRKKLPKNNPFSLDKQ